MSDESKGCPIQAGDYVRVVKVPPAHEEDFQLGDELVVESVRSVLGGGGEKTWMVYTPEGAMFIDRFEKIENYWADITDPDHVLNEKTDWVRHEERGWARVDGLHGLNWGSVNKSAFPQARCRRKDLPNVEPERPVEVHTGGPYVAWSVHDRVCNERNIALAQAVRIRDESVKLVAERDGLQKQVENLGRDVDILKGFNRELKQHGTSFELLEKLKDTEDRLAAQSKDMIWMTENQDKVISNQRDRIADLIDRLGKEFRSSSKGWPLVPVDPLCIPEGHRAVEVTRNTGGKLVVSPKRTIFMYNREHDWPRLVVEPIPTPAQDALPRPEFPAWIRAGWWVAMDLNKDWYAYESDPTTYDTGHNDGKDCLDLTEHLTPSMKAVPVTRWREAKWQVE